jgi:hypothetical protein
MAETKRAPARDPRTRDLDTATDHMAEILRRSDALLAEWSQFGVAVRAQVEREAMRVGDVVGAAVDGAAARATTAAVDRALTERIGTQLAAISAEVGKLETRARAASRAISEQRRSDRALLIGVIVAVLIANGLLVVLLLRKPAAAAPLAPEPVPVLAPSASEPKVEPPKTDEAADLSKDGTDSKAGDAPATDAKAGDPKAKTDAKPKPGDAKLDPKSKTDADPKAKDTDPKAKPDPKAKREAQAKWMKAAVPAVIEPRKQIKQGPPSGRP